MSEITTEAGSQELAFTEQIARTVIGLLRQRLSSERSELLEVIRPALAMRIGDCIFMMDSNGFDPELQEEVLQNPKTLELFAESLLALYADDAEQIADNVKNQLIFLHAFYEILSQLEEEMREGEVERTASTTGEALLGSGGVLPGGLNIAENAREARLRPPIFPRAFEE